jgi:hypothetical protein
VRDAPHLPPPPPPPTHTHTTPTMPHTTHTQQQHPARRPPSLRGLTCIGLVAMRVRTSTTPASTPGAERSAASDACSALPLPVSSEYPSSHEVAASSRIFSALGGGWQRSSALCAGQGGGVALGGRTGVTAPHSARGASCS